MRLFNLIGFDYICVMLYNEIKEFLRFKERMIFMNLAKISANGQITIPVEIRRHLGLKTGDKIVAQITDDRKALSIKVQIPE